MKLDGAKCVVLGGGGFIGTNLCLALAAAGANVEIFGRPSPNSGVLTGMLCHEGEFADVSHLREAIRGKDYVFHLLGGSVPAESNSDPAADVAASVLPSLNLIEICRTEHVKRIIFASSGGTIYGITGAEPISETAPSEPITAYGINKLAVEKYLGLYRRLHGLDSVVLRISNPYGRFQHGKRPQGVVGTMLARALAGEKIEVWGDGSVVRDFVHVDDVANAMISAATYSGPERVFNVGSGVGHSLRNVVDSISQAVGLRPDQISYLPGRSMDVPINVLDIGLIGRTIGWKPQISWSDGLASTVEWMRSASGQR